MKYILSNKIILCASPLLTKSKMREKQEIYSIIGFTIRPNIYKYANSLIDTKLFCRLLMKVTL